MELPKFLLADDLQENEASRFYIVHTEYPRFILDPESEDMEWFDDVSEEDEQELEQILVGLIDEAQSFLEEELNKFDE